ncbi:MAG: GTP-binding protein [Candidatus Lokiarchaeota archaeon]|nr:GTP-binding protein [Candidatus Lokiarchaeota archaeon]
MAIPKEKLFSDLFKNFLEIDPHLEAVIVSDREGFVIAGEKREDVDIELISVLTALINPILERIRDEFAFKLRTSSSFDTDQYRLLFISIDENITLSIVLSNIGSVDSISPYAYFLAEKVAQIVFGSEGDNIQISIPNFQVELDPDSDSRKIKDQIYQMRLDSGGRYRFKFVIIGDHMVGKTSIIRRFVENKFATDYRATIGLNILTHKLEFYGNEIIFSLWDIGAQEFFKRFRKTYYQGVQASFIVFDLTNKDSFINIKKWFNELKELIGSREIPIVVVGNKSDLSGTRKIDYQFAIKLVNELANETFEGGISYIETSALTGENIEDAFSLIAYHYIIRSKAIEEEKVKQEFMNQINLILKQQGKLRISFITENPFWSPGLQILNETNELCECEKVQDDKENRNYEYSNGLIVKNFIYDSFDVSDSDGVFIIFDARDKEKIDSKWKEVVLNIVAQLNENKVALIGIRVSEKTDWSNIIEDFEINKYLEKKMVSVLFFKIGMEYRLEIYDQLQIMLSAILDS